MPIATSYSVENDEIIARALKRAAEEIGDLRAVFEQIADDFFISQAAIWKLKGPGQYEDLKPRTKKQKKKLVGFIYPILQRTGRLKRSMTLPGSGDTIKVINKDYMILGTNVPYGIYHQSDAPRSKIPLRKFLFIGPEAKQFADSDQKGRVQRWLGIIEGHIDAAHRKRGLK